MASGCVRADRGLSAQARLCSRDRMPPTLSNLDKACYHVMGSTPTNGEGLALINL